MKITKPINDSVEGYRRAARPYVAIMSDNAYKYPPDRPRNRGKSIPTFIEKKVPISPRIDRTRTKLRHALTGIQNSTNFNILSTSVALRARLIPRFDMRKRTVYYAELIQPVVYLRGSNRGD